MWKEVYVDNAQTQTERNHNDNSSRYVNLVHENSLLFKTYLLLKTIFLRKGESAAQPDILLNLRDKLLVKLINVCLNKNQPNFINDNNDLTLVHQILNEYKNENLTLNFDRLNSVVNLMSSDGLTFETDDECDSRRDQQTYLTYASSGLKKLVNNLTHVREMLAQAMRSLSQNHEQIGTMLKSLLPYGDSVHAKTLKLNRNYREKVDDLVFKIVREMLSSISGQRNSATIDELNKLMEEIKRATVGPIFVVRSKSDTHGHGLLTGSYIHVTRLSASKRPVRTYSSSNLSTYSNVKSDTSKRFRRTSSSSVISYVNSVQSVEHLVVDDNHAAKPTAAKKNKNLQLEASTSVFQLPGIGKAYAERLKKEKLYTLGDLVKLYDKNEVKFRDVLRTKLFMKKNSISKLVEIVKMFLSQV